MLQNVGIQLHHVFFINGPNGPTDVFHSVVRSVTATNKYDVMYNDNDEEEMGEAEFEICKMKVKDQVVTNLANVSGARFWKDVNDYNCANGHCYHSWSKETSGFNPKEGGGAFTANFRRDRPNERHHQILLHLIMNFMLLSALHILRLTPLIFWMKFQG